VDGDGVGPQLQSLLHHADLDLVVGVGAQGGAGGHMDDEADVAAIPPVAVLHHPLLLEDGVGAPLRHPVHHLREVDEPLDGADGYPVVHGDDDGVLALPVDDPLHPHPFADLAQFRISFMLTWRTIACVIYKLDAVIFIAIKLIPFRRPSELILWRRSSAGLKRAIRRNS